MWDQWDTDILQGLISAPFKRRNKDQVWVHTHDHLVVEIPFYADFGGLPALETFVHLPIEQMPGTGHPYDLVSSPILIKLDNCKDVIQTTLLMGVSITVYDPGMPDGFVPLLTSA